MIFEARSTATIDQDEIQTDQQIHRDCLVGRQAAVERKAALSELELETVHVLIYLDSTSLDPLLSQNQLTKILISR